MSEVADEVNGYLYSYLSLNTIEKEQMKAIYIGLIVLSLNQLRPHLDFLPFHEGSPLL